MKANEIVSKSQTIGNVDVADIIDSARDIERNGGPPVPTHAKYLSDIPTVDSSLVFSLSRSINTHDNSAYLAVSSGGTTGVPKPVYVPMHQGTERVVESWKPFCSENLVLNLFNPGHMWGSHQYAVEITRSLGCGLIPMGSVEKSDLPSLYPTLSQMPIDSIAGTPTSVHSFLMGLKEFGLPLPIKKIFWVGEAWPSSKIAQIREYIPSVEFWGCYGSVETYVVGINGPECEHGTFHLLPDQAIEVEERYSYLSRVGSGWTLPWVRYQLGDRVRSATCSCGRNDAFVLKGRVDDGIQFKGSNIVVSEILDLARSHPLVVDAQMEIIGTKEYSSAKEITIRYTGEVHSDVVRRYVFSSSSGVSFERLEDEIGFENRCELDTNQRTKKILPVIWVIDEVAHD